MDFDSGIVDHRDEAAFAKIFLAAFPQYRWQDVLRRQKPGLDRSLARRLDAPIRSDPPD
jgi:hypothetical protein